MESNLIAPKHKRQSRLCPYRVRDVADQLVWFESNTAHKNRLAIQPNVFLPPLRFDTRVKLEEFGGQVIRSS